ncbi:hypothetical protein ACHAW5_006856 [Stephanodiscus triporus]|uniref:Uncharacterized protein n=1 Tax=Stephanodiscus triporus TaxID=2934178 RepID=A0ABD3MVI3_9STRA
MNTDDLHEATLVSVKFGSDPLVEETDVFTGREVLTTNPGSVVRGDARILQAKKDAGELEGFRICSIVKETGIDDEGLNEFATEYFPYETYKDQGLTFYNALGAGKMSIGYNPLAMIKFIMDSIKRTKELGIKSYNTKGEGFLQGGWILFDKEGIPRAAFQENAKVRVPIDDLLKEVKLMRDSKE